MDAHGGDLPPWRFTRVGQGFEHHALFGIEGVETSHKRAFIPASRVDPITRVSDHINDAKRTGTLKGPLAHGGAGSRLPLVVPQAVAYGCW